MQGSREQDPEATEGGASEDDMAEGDLGDGMGHRPRKATTRKKLLSRGHMEELLPRFGLRRVGSEGSNPAFAWTSCSSLYTPFKEELEWEQIPLHWRVRDTEFLSDLSNEELRERLQEATEEVELLRCELEVKHRHLEGKQEALKILQGQAILDKATTHTKSLLQKSEERTKALEKEVNALQWEIGFNQVQFKNFEQHWERKYERVCNENKALSDSLEERVTEVQVLRSENAALSQQCLELLAMLSVKDQRAFQGTKPLCGQAREGNILELAVLGACQCPSVREPCPCARSAAASRKQVLQLRQELDAQRRRKEEALMVADAFRIAFEQQLRRKSYNFLLLAEKDRHTSRPHKTERGIDKQNSVSVAQRLRAMLPSNKEVKMFDDPTETLHRLLDLLNDKEEALAHQRKVSLMLAHNAKELEGRLQTDHRLETQDMGQNCAHPDPDILNHVQYLCQGAASDSKEFQCTVDDGAKTGPDFAKKHCLCVGESLTERRVVDDGGGVEE